jgi:hypothetical protein
MGLEELGNVLGGKRSGGLGVSGALEHVPEERLVDGLLAELQEMWREADELLPEPVGVAAVVVAERLVASRELA